MEYGDVDSSDVGANEPAYLKLFHPVHGNLLPNGVEVSDRKGTIDRVLHELFQHCDSAQKYMQGSKSMKIENTILLDNYVRKGGSSSVGRTRALNGFKHSKKHMSLQHMKIGSFDLPVPQFGVSAESMQFSYDLQGNIITTILLLMQRHLYSLGGLQAEGIFKILLETARKSLYGTN